MNDLAFSVPENVSNGSDIISVWTIMFEKVGPSDGK